MEISLSPGPSGLDLGFSADGRREGAFPVVAQASLKHPPHVTPSSDDHVVTRGPDGENPDS